LLFNRAQRLGPNIVFVDEASRLFLGQLLERIRDAQAAGLAAPRTHLLEHALELLGELLHAGRADHIERRCCDCDVDFDFTVVEFTFP
jgi:hypothetical protein